MLTRIDSALLFKTSLVLAGLVTALLLFSRIPLFGNAAFAFLPTLGVLLLACIVGTIAGLFDKRALDVARPVAASIRQLRATLVSEEPIATLRFVRGDPALVEYSQRYVDPACEGIAVVAKPEGAPHEGVWIGGRGPQALAGWTPTVICSGAHVYVQYFGGEWGSLGFRQFTHDGFLVAEYRVALPVSGTDWWLERKSIAEQGDKLLFQMTGWRREWATDASGAPVRGKDGSSVEYLYRERRALLSIPLLSRPAAAGT